MSKYMFFASYFVAFATGYMVGGGDLSIAGLMAIAGMLIALIIH